MRIVLNGDPTDLSDGATISTLVERLSLQGKRMAVEVNEEVVPRSEYAAFALKPDDEVEIVHAVGGG